jgi:hypothetical protein
MTEDKKNPREKVIEKYNEENLNEAEILAEFCAEHEVKDEKGEIMFHEAAKNPAEYKLEWQTAKVIGNREIKQLCIVKK